MPNPAPMRSGARAFWRDYFRPAPLAATNPQSPEALRLSALSSQAVEGNTRALVAEIVALLWKVRRYAKPIDPLKEGETLTIGPGGQRGIWRTIGGNPIFVAVEKGQSVPDAIREAQGKSKGKEAAPAIQKSAQRAWAGESRETRARPSKQAVGKLAEGIATAWLYAQGVRDAGSLNVTVNNFPLDLVHDHEVIEVKAGLVSNGPDAQKWRATIGEPGNLEKAWLAKASPARKAAWNAQKQALVLQRKEAAAKAVEKVLGRKVKRATVALIVDPDRKVADLYRFEGFHTSIRWKSEEAQAAYVGSVKFAAKFALEPLEELEDREIEPVEGDAEVAEDVQAEFDASLAEEARAWAKALLARLRGAGNDKAATFAFDPAVASYRPDYARIEQTLDALQAQLLPRLQRVFRDAKDKIKALVARRVGGGGLDFRFVEGLELRGLGDLVPLLRAYLHSTFLAGRREAGSELARAKGRRVFSRFFHAHTLLAARLKTYREQTVVLPDGQEPTFVDSDPGHGPCANCGYTDETRMGACFGCFITSGDEPMKDWERKLFSRWLHENVNWPHAEEWQAKPYAKPIEPLKEGETLTIGPDGKRGVWRTIGGNPIFVEVEKGQSVPEAVRQAEAGGKQEPGGTAGMPLPGGKKDETQRLLAGLAKQGLIKTAAPGTAEKIHQIFGEDLSGADIFRTYVASLGGKAESFSLFAAKAFGRDTVLLSAEVRMPDGGLVSLERMFHRGDDGGLVVTHSSLALSEKLQGFGLGRKLYEAQEALYESIGVSRVELIADGSIGKYTWAMHGYDFTGEGGRKAIEKRYYSLAKKLQVPVPPAGTFKHSWEFAAYAAPGPKITLDAKLRSQLRKAKFQLSGGVRDGEYDFGKFALLAGEDWEGVKRYAGAAGTVSRQIGKAYLRGHKPFAQAVEPAGGGGAYTQDDPPFHAELAGWPDDSSGAAAVREEILGLPETIVRQVVEDLRGENVEVIRAEVRRRLKKGYPRVYAASPFLTVTDPFGGRARIPLAPGGVPTIVAPSRVRPTFAPPEQVPPAAAINYFEDKAFAWKGILADDLLADIKRILLGSITTGEPPEETYAALERVFGPYVGDLAALPDQEQTQPYRLETLVRTNSTEAFSAGRKDAFADSVADGFITGFEVDATIDTRTTPVCLFLNGKILPPFGEKLDRLTPPRCWNCRSILSPITRIEDPDPEIISDADFARAVELSCEGFSAQAKARAYAEGGHDFSSTQLNLPDAVQSRLRAWVAANVSPEDLSPDEKQDDAFHVTVLYGLHGADGRPVAEAVAGSGPVTFRLGAVAVFDTNPDYDVLILPALDSDGRGYVWDESLHPREPAGGEEGGQFAPAGEAGPGISLHKIGDLGRLKTSSRGGFKAVLDLESGRAAVTRDAGLEHGELARRGLKTKMDKTVRLTWTRFGGNESFLRIAMPETASAREERGVFDSLLRKLDLAGLLPRNQEDDIQVHWWHEENRSQFGRGHAAGISCREYTHSGLLRLRARLEVLPHTTTQAEYHPHVTLAYIKKGKGRRFLGAPSPVDAPITVDRLRFTSWRAGAGATWVSLLPGAKPYALPLLEEGETKTIGPEGKSGVWRTVNGRKIFIEAPEGVSVPEAVKKWEKRSRGVARGTGPGARLPFESAVASAVAIGAASFSREEFRAAGARVTEAEHARHLARLRQSLGDALVIENPMSIASDPELLGHIAELSNISPTLLRWLREGGVRVTIGKGGLPDVDELQDRRGKAPYGWPQGRFWDHVPGGYAAGERMVVIGVNDPQTYWHGSRSLVLHETGHALDDMLGRPSATASFKKVVDADSLLIPYHKHPAEAFAETTAAIFASTESRRLWFRAHPALSREVLATFRGQFVQERERRRQARRAA